MSSVYVRNSMKNFLTSNSSEKFIELDGHYENIEDLLVQEGTDMNSPWVGLSYTGNDEIPISIAAGNNQGVYRETGLVQIHIVDIAKLGVSGSMMARAEVLRNLLRGSRVSDIKVESISPPNFDLGTTLEFEAGFMSCTFSVTYEYDKIL
jgi:hypothetical protein